ncbi:MAG: DUF3089 domain-containing protein [Flavobacteriales bacterium]
MRFLLFILTFTPVLAAFSQPLDFSNSENWLVLPGKSPTFFTERSIDSTLLTSVDVFYIFPTILIDYSDSRWNAEMSDVAWRKEALETAIRYQASAWLECGRMFAPFYRQAHLKAYDSLQGRGRTALLYAYEDIRASFQFYLENYNQGRPFILAGHSQGCTQLTLLIKEFIDEKPLAKQLIAAYMPGIGLDRNEFHSIPFMTTPNQVGGFVTWNTMNDQPDNDLYPLWYKGKACINPVTWDLSKTSTRSMHNGFYYSNEKCYEHVFDTELIDGAICVRNFRSPFQFAVKKYKNLHIGDVNLFWKDIEINCKERIKAYLDAF